MPAVDVLTRHDCPWSIGFRHENPGASAFWRCVADTVFRPGTWREEGRSAPGLPESPADHFIHSS